MKEKSLKISSLMIKLWKEN